jgi:hypothetical protein
MIRNYMRPFTAGLLLAAACGHAQAAGGHHSVDNASILARGECGQETWFTRGDGGQRLLHTGLNCGVGPVELGLAAERSRDPGEAAVTQWFPEVKWAREVAHDVSVGFDVQPIVQGMSHLSHAGTIAYGIVTWQLHESLALHADFGRDFMRGAPDQSRAGLEAEWVPSKAWSFVAERYREQGTNFVRVGPRWAGGRQWSVDFSRAQRLRGPNPSNWTIGLSFELGGD